jgi:hypothetical protein
LAGVSYVYFKRWRPTSVRQDHLPHNAATHSLLDWRYLHDFDCHPRALILLKVVNGSFEGSFELLRLSIRPTSSISNISLLYEHGFI